MSKLVGVVVVLSVLANLMPGSLNEHVEIYRKAPKNGPKLERILYENNNNTENFYIFPNINAYLASKGVSPSQPNNDSATDNCVISESTIQPDNETSSTPSTIPTNPTNPTIPTTTTTTTAPETSTPGVKPLGLTPKNCYKVLQSEEDVQGIPVSSKLFMTYCSDLYQERGWITVQRQEKGAVSFQRNWTDYRNGFGDEDGDFWIGLQRLNKLSTKDPQQLLIILLDSELNFYFERYDSFEVDNEAERFAIRNLGSSYGSAGDSLRDNENKPFSTFDKDHDSKAQRHCANDFGGGWWYYGTICSRSNLNGVYNQTKSVKAISWDSINPNPKLIYTEMLIRSSCDNDIEVYPKLVK